MEGSFVKLMVGIISLATALFAWWIQRDAEKKKRINDEDKKIDAVSNADDTIVELDRLRNEPPAHRP